jgi:signal transduction histidine kinase
VRRTRDATRRSIVLLCRSDGTVLQVFLDELGIAPAFREGTSLIDFLAPSCFRQARNFLSKIQETDTVLGQRLRLSTPHPTSLFFYGHRTGHGTALFGTTKLLRDTSARTSMELLASASHDLRNPISGILASSSYLLEDASAQLNEEQCRLLESIGSASRFLLRLLDGMLELSGIESGNLRFNLQPTDVLPLIDQSILMNRALAQNKGIRMVVTSDESTPRIVADPSRVGEVIDNLLTNAIKFSLPGGSIEVHVSRRRDMTAIAISDNGPGIPPNETKLVFEPFKKGRTLHDSGRQGAGLGLAIVKRIVEGHGGRVEIESSVGEGSIFTVLFPNAQKSRIPKQPRTGSRQLVAGGFPG